MDVPKTGVTLNVTRITPDEDGRDVDGSVELNGAGYTRFHFEGHDGQLAQALPVGRYEVRGPLPKDDAASPTV